MKNAIAQNATAPAGPPPRARRRENRIRVNMPVRITYQGLLTEVSQEGICTDISETGIGFETEASLYVGEVLYLEFPHQNAVPIRFQARLLYKMGNRYGAYFV